MKKRTKNKTKTNKPAVRKQAVRPKKYESHYLAVFLVAFLLLEGCLFSITQTSDWQKGAEVLDVSQAVIQTVSDVAAVFEPVTMAVAGVNQFYSIATTETTKLLDLSGTDPLGELSLVTVGVNNFYQEAATQMSQVLDVSLLGSWSGNVAGAQVIVR